MSREVNSAAEIQARIAKGWKPNRYLSNILKNFSANSRSRCNICWSVTKRFFARLGSTDAGTPALWFVCEPDGALLTYTTDSPALDEPSAGYIFTHFFI